MTKRSRGILRWVLGGIAVVLIVAVVTVSLVAGRYITAFDNFLNKVTVGEAMNPGAEEVSLMDEPFIVYISGSDSRGDIDDAARSDVNIVVVVNAIEGRCYWYRYRAILMCNYMELRVCVTSSLTRGCMG